MLRFFFLAVTAALLVSVGYILLPRHSGRPDAHLDTAPAAAAPDPTTFTVHEAPPTPLAGAPTSGPSQPGSVDLDAVMQRLRTAVPRADTAPDVAPATAPPAPTPQVITPTPPPSVPPGARWTNVTAQGARWRMLPGSDGFVVAIDIGGNRVASVHVASAFANLDPLGMNQRVDYLKQTILQNFPPESANYTFARDGSVSLDH